jgi:flavin reductase (DIM6/NTAB) family NADH-FMN oxidoreductase RutF
MDNALKKTVLRLFTYGVYAVTARQGAEVSLMTANWLTQCSFEPPLIVLAVEVDSHSRQVIEASGAFAINLYESGQRELAGSLGRTFAKHPEKVSDTAWTPSPHTGSPLLPNTLGWIECKIISNMPAGDHILCVAEVLDVGLNHEGQPLTLKETGFKYAG